MQPSGGLEFQEGRSLKAADRLQLILARCPSLTSSKNRLRDKTYCHPSHATADWTFLVDQQLASIATCSSLFANLSATQ